MNEIHLTIFASSCRPFVSVCVYTKVKVNGVGQAVPPLLEKYYI